MDFTLQELACLDAVVREGSFQAAAIALHRTHPAVHAAVRSLERRTGTALLDRSAYRVRLTSAGEAFHRQAAVLLSGASGLQSLSRQLSRGEETDLRVVIGDMTPAPPVLRQLKRFIAAWPRTRLHLHFEALGGPLERLQAEEADLVVHHVDKADPALDWVDLLPVAVVPVVAPGFLPFALTRSLAPERMRGLVQVIIRDSARAPGRDYYLVDGGQRLTVADQHTKKELIVQGLGWGHMPLHLVDKELRSGKLLSLEGRHFKRARLDIVAARLRRRPAGPVAQALREALAGG